MYNEKRFLLTLSSYSLVKRNQSAFAEREKMKDELTRSEFESIESNRRKFEATRIKLRQLRSILRGRGGKTMTHHHRGLKTLTK